MTEPENQPTAERKKTMEKPTDTTNTATAQALTRPSASTLNAEQLDILHHANKPESKGQFVGGSFEMTGLVACGFMKNLGRPSWCPDNFYQLTKEGLEFLSSNA